MPKEMLEVVPGCADINANREAARKLMSEGGYGPTSISP